MTRTASPLAHLGITWRFAAALIAFAVPSCALAEKNPPSAATSGPKAAELGKAYFNRACTYCHGKEGAGGKTPSFKGRKDFTAKILADVIANGRVNGANIMPAWKGSLSEEQIAQLVAYILELSRQPADDE